MINVEDHISWAEVVALKFRREKNIPIEYEEAISLGMVGLMEAAIKYRESEGKFRTFAWLRIRGKVKDWVKRDVKRGRVAPMVYSEDIPEWQLPFVNGTEKRVADKELVDRLLSFLTAKQAQAIKLYYLEEYSMMDVARNCGVTESNICQHIHRGMERMKRVMELGYVWKYQKRKE